MKNFRFTYLLLFLVIAGSAVFPQQSADEMIRQDIRVFKIQMTEDLNALDKRITVMSNRIATVDKRVAAVNTEIDDLFIFMWIMLGLFCIMTIAMTSFIITTKAMTPVVQSAYRNTPRKKAAKDDELEDRIDDVVGKLQTYKKTNYRKRRGIR